MNAIRLSPKAIIIHDRQVLVIQKRDAQGDYYLLPGGGPDHGESLPDALRRECREELGAAFAAGELRFVREYIGRRLASRAPEAPRDCCRSLANSQKRC